MKLLFADGSVQGESAQSLLDASIRGGRIGSLIEVSNRLAMFGHDVHVLGRFERDAVSGYGVTWVREPDDEYDVIIFNRGLGDGMPDVFAPRRVLWTHDLPHNGFVQDPRMLSALTAIIHQSRYSQWVWNLFFSRARKVRSGIIPNGVRDEFRVADISAKEPTIIFASAPNRGLSRLPFLWEAISARVPGWRCKVFSNAKALHPGEHEPGEQLEWFKSCEEAGIERSDPIPQSALADELKSASLMLLPSDYPELCSNAVLQSLAAGTPVVTTGRLGATPEWVRDGRNGLLTESMVHDYMVYQVEVVRRVTELMRDHKALLRLIRGALRTKVPSWDEIASRWDRVLFSLR